MRRSLARAVLASLAVLALGAAPASAIVGGEPDDGSHPMVALFVAQDEAGNPLFRCSGSLLSATVLVTAGHCTSDEQGDEVAGVELWFADDLDASAEFLAALADGDSTPCADDTGQRLSGYPCTGEVSGTAYTHPDFDPADFTTRDLGVVVLDEPVVLADYAELPEVGAFDSWASNEDRWFTSVGYGVEKALGSGAVGKVAVDNERRVATTRLKAINKSKTDDYSMLLTNNTKGGTCTGDSGGPNFVEDTLVIAGVTSFGVSQNTCGGQGGIYRLDREEDREWLESFLTVS